MNNLKPFRIVMFKKKYHCPRCGETNIYEHNNTFDCFKCNLEFDKEDCDNYDDEDILSIEEKLAFHNGFQEEE